MAYVNGVTNYFRYRTYKIVGGITYHSAYTIAGSAALSSGVGSFTGALSHTLTIPAGADGVLIERLSGSGGTATAWLNTSLATIYDDGDNFWIDEYTSFPWNAGAPVINLIDYGYAVLNLEDGDTTWGLSTNRPIRASNFPQDLSTLATKKLALALAIAL